MATTSVLTVYADSERTLRGAFELAAAQTELTAEKIVLNIHGRINLSRPLKIKNTTVPIEIIGENALLDGGYRLGRFEETSINGVYAWRVYIEPQTASRMLFDQLFINGSRRFRASLCAGDDFRLCGLVSENGTSRDAVLADWLTSMNRFSYSGDLPKISHPEDTELHICHCWRHERMQVASVDYEKKQITTATCTTLGALADDKYMFCNVREALSCSGEYYFDFTESMLYYIPLEGESIESTEAVIPMLDSVMEFENCTDITLSDISFRYVSGRCDFRDYLKDRRLTEAMVSTTHMQSENNLSGCVNFKGCRDCTVERCAFTGIGVFGIAMTEPQNKHMTVTKCTFRDLGSGALKVGGEQNTSRTAMEPDAYISFTDNDVNGYGVIYHSACAVIMAHVSHALICGNEIQNGDYTAVSCGWEWGYGETGYYENRIENNHIHHIGKKRLDDMGAIYLLGIQPFTRIAGNKIHDVYGDKGKCCFGIYLDEGSSGVTVENNLVYNILSDAMHIHYGRDNIVTGNIFALCDEALLSATRREEHTQLRVENNIFYSKNAKILRLPKDSTAVLTNNNLYYSKEGNPSFSRNAFMPDESYIGFEEWRNEYGSDKLSRIADPMFEDLDKYNFNLKEESPAFGFIM